jgi:hypothetical protein
MEQNYGPERMVLLTAGLASAVPGAFIEVCGVILLVASKAEGLLSVIARS